MLKEENANKHVQELKNYYDNLLKRLEDDAHDSDRAYGGYVRAFKGELVEYLARELVTIAWVDVLNQDINRMRITKEKMPVLLTNKYGFLDKIKNQDVKDYLTNNIDSQKYNFGTDAQVFIDNKLVLPIECKAYTENAMIKRILFDADLMKEVAGCKTYYLLQLESQLGGDYSQLNDITYGSPSTNALMSHVDINLEIITLLKGERKVDEPIHKPEYFKELKINQLEKAVMIFAKALQPYIK